MAAPAKRIVKELPAWRKALAKWAYNISYFPQLGLMMDDCVEETSDVKEAIRRLSKDEYDARQFRITRALLLSAKKDILPKEEWQTYEQDQRYLKPLVEEVKAERLEKEAWNKQ